MENINITTTAESFHWTTSFYTNQVKFIILTVLQCFSIPCFLWIFYQFSRQPQLRHSQYHHVIFLLLINSFLFVTIALPLTQAYLYTSDVYFKSEIFCSLWIWFHYSINIINLFLMAFASIERNWLVFYPSWTRNKIGKILLHYIPLAFCVLYPPLFYIGMIFIYQCESYYDYTQSLCTYPCYFYNLDLSNIDFFLNNCAPLFAIPIFCCALYVRVFIQRREMKREVFKWKRDKKMILQLWTTSSLYLGMWMPLELCVLINLYWDPLFMYQAQVDYLYLFPYIIHLLYPFVIILTYYHDMVPLKRGRIQPNITATMKRNLPTNIH